MKTCKKIEKAMEERDFEAIKSLIEEIDIHTENEYLLTTAVHYDYF